MAIKCTYVSVAKQNFRGSMPPDPVGEVRNLEDGPETAWKDDARAICQKNTAILLESGKDTNRKMSFK